MTDYTIDPALLKTPREHHGIFYMFKKGNFFKSDKWILADMYGNKYTFNANKYRLDECFIKFMEEIKNK